MERKSMSKIIIFTLVGEASPRVYARGLGLNPPLELDVLRKLYYLRKGN